MGQPDAVLGKVSCFNFFCFITAISCYIQYNLYAMFVNKCYQGMQFNMQYYECCFSTTLIGGINWYYIFLLVMKKSSVVYQNLDHSLKLLTQTTILCWNTALCAHAVTMVHFVAPWCVLRLNRC